VLLALAGLVVANGVRAPPLPSAEVEAVALLAEAAWRAGEPRQAEHFARYGLGSAPQDGVLLHLLGNALADQGRSSEAIEALEGAVAADPARATARVDLGLALAAAGDDPRALAELQQAAAAPDSPADAWYNLGVLHERQGRADVPRDDYAQALARDPLHASARLNLGLLLLRDGQAEQALPHLRGVLRLRPRDDKALAGLAVYYAQRQEFTEAGSLFRQALAANPARNDLRAAYAAMLEQEHEGRPGRSQAPGP
jgi:Tfp pilus assembly protein PilF